MSDVLYEANPSMLRSNPLGTILFVVLLLLGIFVALFSGQLAETLGLSRPVWGTLGIVVAVLAVVRLAWWWVETKMDHLSIRENEVVWSHGLINKQYTEIHMDSVRTTRVSQTLIQRIMGAGDLMIFTSGDLPELHVRGLPEPQKLRELIKSDAPKAG